jgi:ribosomal protein S18 acetylase RimI-like enzyme
MDPTILIRPYRPERDLPALAELVSALQGSTLTADQVQAMISWPGHDPSRDRFVAALGNRLVGMGYLFLQPLPRSFVKVYTHPDFRRQGIGRALVEFLLAESRQRGARHATSGVPLSNEVALAFASACGFEVVGEERYFTAPADLYFPGPQLPEGFAIRSVAELGNAQHFADACNRCYHDMWGHSENVEPVTVEKIEEWRRQYPNILRPAGMFVLFAPDGSPVGVTRADRGGEGAEEYRIIDAPGIAPEYRPLGLQRALVQAAAGWLQHNGSGHYQIETWGDSDDAARIYEDLGFQLIEGSRSIEFVRFLDR